MIKRETFGADRMCACVYACNGVGLQSWRNDGGILMELDRGMEGVAPRYPYPNQHSLTHSWVRLELFLGHNGRIGQIFSDDTRSRILSLKLDRYTDAEAVFFFFGGIFILSWHFLGKGREREKMLWTYYHHPSSATTAGERNFCLETKNMK